LPATIIWKKPTYKLHTNSGLDDQLSFKEILIDVTRSVPPFPETGKVLSDTFADVLNDFPGKAEVKILDFGAGRFRNTIHLLRVSPKNNVGAVEFERLEGISKTHIAEANRFQKRFQQIVYPEDFFRREQRFDLIILVNVLNIMPVSAERLLAIRYCREKLNEGGKILWYSQHKDKFYQEKCTEDNMLGDGYYMRNKSKYQTFYRDFEPYEVDEMFLASGMKLDRKIVAAGVIARLYKVRTSDPLEGVLTPDLIRTHVEGDMDYPEPEESQIKTVKFRKGSKPNLPNPSELAFEKLYEDALTRLPKSNAANFEYQNLVAAIFSRLFLSAPDHLELEKEVMSGLKRIDIFITNTADSGFFRTVRETHRVISPYVLVECKNYSVDIKNAEVDQLTARLTVDWGRFGIIVCRKNTDKDGIMNRLKGVRKIEPKNHVLCLEDSDMIRLLRLHLSDPDEVDEYMNSKMEEIKLN